MKTIFIVVILCACIQVHSRAEPIERIKRAPSVNDHPTKNDKIVPRIPACFYTSDCPPHSRCSGGQCECDRNWMTPKKGGLCAYEQRSKWITFILSFFFGTFGVDWFYLSHGTVEYIIAGVIKALLGCASCCTLCLKCLLDDVNTTPISSLKCITSLFGIIGNVWWLVDWIRILVGVFPDGNGIRLYD